MDNKIYMVSGLSARAHTAAVFQDIHSGTPCINTLELIPTRFEHMIYFSKSIRKHALIAGKIRTNALTALHPEHQPQIVVVEGQTWGAVGITMNIWLLRWCGGFCVFVLWSSRFGTESLGYTLQEHTPSYVPLLYCAQCYSNIGINTHHCISRCLVVQNVVVHRNKHLPSCVPMTCCVQYIHASVAKVHLRWIIPHGNMFQSWMGGGSCLSEVLIARIRSFPIYMGAGRVKTYLFDLTQL